MTVRQPTLADLWLDSIADATLWPKWLRRVYLLTLPLSYPIRAILGVLIVLIVGTEHVARQIGGYFRKVWG